MHPLLGMNQFMSTSDANEKRRLQALQKALRIIEDDLSLPLLLTLVTVTLNPGISVSELAEHIEIPQQTASRYMSTLLGRYQMPGNDANSFAQAPYLSLEINNEDPRRRALFVTAKGKAKVSKIINQLYNGEA